MITAKIIADSISGLGIRLTTMELCYPKFPHADLMTHRVFSRSARSSRAMPVKKMLHEVRTDPVMPIEWLSNRAGMQGGEPLHENVAKICEDVWRKMAQDTAKSCEALGNLGLHKQWANRPLDCFSNIYVVVTSTYWKNWYGLRRHEDAQPEIRALADAMYHAHKASTPQPLRCGEWHVPYVDVPVVRTQYDWDTLCKISAARCARVSYRTFDNRVPTLEEDLALFDKLMGSQPLHASPAEHQATPDYYRAWSKSGEWAMPDLHGNFFGWNQFRKTLPFEDGSGFDCDIPNIL